MKQVLFLTLLVVLFFPLSAHAALHTEFVEYTEGNTVLEGYLAYDDAVAQKRPGVLVVHEWKGLGSYAQKRAEQLAELGYVAFAADIYGKGIRPQTNEEAGAQAGIYKNNRPLLRARVNAALDILKNNALVDSQKMAAIGYCFGGTTVLELARSGADVRGVVSFHGGLNTPAPDDAKNIKAKVLVLHGADDPYVSPEEVGAFKEEMAKGNVNLEFVAYPGAVHSFTNPDAGDDPSKGAAYNVEADQKSWEAMKVFFNGIFQ